MEGCTSRCGRLRVRFDKETLEFAQLMMTGDAIGMAAFADSVWTASTRVRFAATWFPHVMTVIKLTSGELLLHSPCRPSGDLIGNIARIGNVAHVVAPNWFHDLYLSEYRRLYPNATFWGPRFLQRRRQRIVDGVLDDGARPPWFDELPYVTLRGLLTFDECVFFHAASRTLVVADLLMNVYATERTPLFSRVVSRVFHLDGTLKVFPLARWIGPRNRAVLHDAVEQMLDWNPKGLIVGHGQPTSEDVPAQLRSAFNWLEATCSMRRRLE